MLARHGRRLLNLLDDTPIVPGDTRPAFEHGHQARQILNDAEEDLREWQPNLEPIHSQADGMGANLMPNLGGSTTAPSEAGQETLSPTGGHHSQGQITAGEGTHLQQSIESETPQHRALGESSGVAEPHYTHSEGA